METVPRGEQLRQQIVPTAALYLAPINALQISPRSAPQHALYEVYSRLPDDP